MSENKGAAESIELQEGIEAVPLRKRVRNLLILIGVHVDDNKRRTYKPARGGASLTQFVYYTNSYKCQGKTGWWANFRVADQPAGTREE